MYMTGLRDAFGCRKSLIETVVSVSCKRSVCVALDELRVKSMFSCFHSTRYVGAH